MAAYLQQILPEILLWLFVVNLGIALGAGLYEMRVVVPLWASNPPVSIGHPDSGLRFWVFVSTGPLTILCLANLFYAWQALGPRHNWWLVAAILELVSRLMTFGYFIPTVIRLQRSQAPAAEVRAKFSQWITLNYVRVILTLAAWLAALKTLTLPAA
jgi:hypothetical protein